MEITENSKKKVWHELNLLFHFVLWYEWVNFRVYVFYFHACVNKCEIIVWLKIIILRPPEKGVPWKFWLDPRFPRNPKLKQILKWLPLDRGCFKVYFFAKGESLLIISCHTYLLTRNLSFYFKTCPHCHAFCSCWIVP